MHAARRSFGEMSRRRYFRVLETGSSPARRAHASFRAPGWRWRRFSVSDSSSWPRWRIPALGDLGWIGLEDYGIAPRL